MKAVSYTHLDVYKRQVQVTSRGNYILRYWAQTKSEPIASKGEITFSLPVRTLEEKQEPQAEDVYKRQDPHPSGSRRWPGK